MDGTVISVVRMVAGILPGIMLSVMPGFTSVKTTGKLSSANIVARPSVSHQPVTKR